MKTTHLLLTLFLAGLALTSCKKNKDDTPSLNGVDGHITNIDGKDIHFSSSSGNTAQILSSSGLNLKFNDSKSQVQINVLLWDITLDTPGNYTLHDSTNTVSLQILSNPSGQQYFSTDAYSSDNGTVVITTITKDHVIGELKQATLEGGGSTTITIHDCKFNLKVE